MLHSRHFSLAAGIPEVNLEALSNTSGDISRSDFQALGCCGCPRFRTLVVQHVELAEQLFQVILIRHMLERNRFSPLLRFDSGVC